MTNSNLSGKPGLVQIEVLRSSARDKLGIKTLDDLTDSGLRDKVIRTFWVRKQVEGLNTTTSGSVALSLLQGLSASAFYQQ